MKAIQRLMVLATLCIAPCYLMAKQYCYEPLTQGNHKIYLTCQKMGDNQYQLRIDADVELTGLGGSFMNVNGTGGYQLNADNHSVLSDDKKTIICDIESTSEPSLYTPLYVKMPDEVNFGEITDITWGSCEGVSKPDPEPENPNPGEDTPQGTQWSDYMGDGAGGGIYSNLYRVEKVEGITAVNIQDAANNKGAGIYLKLPAAPITECNVAHEADGAGIWLLLTAFTQQETTVTIVANSITYTFKVWYENGITSDTPTVIPSYSAPANNARKVIENGQIYILKNGIRYNIFGMRVDK